MKKQLKIFGLYLTVLSITSLHAATPKTPIDSNLKLGHEKGILYYVDPRPEEGGENRALRINTNTMTYTEMNVDGTNPHSIDRAGNTNKFYIRTQNSYSFDVLDFVNDTISTVSLEDHKPRAIGATNLKYKVQLLSALDMPVVDIINTQDDSIISTVGDRHTFTSNSIDSNGGGAATGHAIWLTKRYFALLDRVHSKIKLYKVFKRKGKISTVLTDSIELPSAVHSIEKVKHPRRNRTDRFTFYALGEGKLGSVNPFVAKLKLIPKRGKLSATIHYLSQSTQAVNGIKPTTHHAGISPNKRYLIVPVYDGKIYILNRYNMHIVRILDTHQLGAGHIEFSRSRRLAIVTNHFSDKVTFIDMKTLTVKKYLTISHHKFDPSNKHLLQPHFSYVSKNGKYFYTFATQDGDFLKIDLDNLEIVDTLHTGGTPEQAHS